MYKSEFDKYLKANKRFSSYMFYGQSTFLVEQYAYLVSKIIAQDEEIEKLYFEEYNFKYAKDRLLQSSLFSSNNVVLIKIDKNAPTHHKPVHQRQYGDMLKGAIYDTS